MTMITKRNDIRVLVFLLIGIGCNWSGSLFGKLTLSTNTVPSNRTHTIPYAITKNQSGNFEDRYEIDIYSLFLNGSGLNDLVNENQMSDLNSNFYIRWYVGDKLTHTNIDLSSWSLDINNNSLTK